MREWIIKLTAAGDDAASALRVIAHFDTLVDERASVLAMLRAAAALANCAVGFDDPSRALRLRVDSVGRSLPPEPSPVSSDSALEEFEGITVWLERDREPWPLDRLILERSARSLHAVKEAKDIHPSTAAIKIVLDPDARPQDREGALRHLGLDTSSITVVATHGNNTHLHRLPPGLSVDGVRIHLLSAQKAHETVSASVAAGMVTCRSEELPHAIKRASVALRVAVDPATAGPAHIHYAQLGSVSHVIELLDPIAAAATDDVRLLEGLRAQRPWAVGLIDAVLSHRSLREIARQQNLHHSTLNERITWLETQLGYAVVSPHGYMRAATSLLLWRIAMADSQRGAA